MFDPLTAERAYRRAQDEARQMQHEHARLYTALETAAEIAELAGHDILAATLRRERRDIAAEQARGGCSERPG